MFFSLLTDQTNDLAPIRDALFSLKDALETGVWPALCVYPCVHVMTGVGFSSKSTMDSYTHYTPSLTKVKPLNKCNVPHNYIHVNKMIEKTDSFLNKALSFMSLLYFFIVELQTACFKQISRAAQ